MVLRYRWIYVTVSGIPIHIGIAPFSVFAAQADDDTYVIMENLRYFLSGENTSEPIYFGHHFKTIVKQGFYSGGGGYVLSKEALRRFGENGMTCVCVNTEFCSSPVKLSSTFHHGHTTTRCPSRCYGKPQTMMSPSSY